MRVIVLGGAGDMGSRAVRDLLGQVTYGAADHMNTLTGVPLAIGTLMLGRGAITERGVIAPEACVPPAQFINELAKRGIRISSGDRLEDVVT